MEAHFVRPMSALLTPVDCSVGGKQRGRRQMLARRYSWQVARLPCLAASLITEGQRAQ